ncbi:hypothetical protein CLHUN_14950 [Ruminiclostridium hungatei]|uniref:Lipoprotein n=1 Tax=Ruminiclostridium hungatei TaxID=48256 RepID=A0A1V4SKS9_RUMHU|nr:hypothetical protein [Ruminiclostridium hungatei]OPX44502.1 hypothetical protein CLHUN_14950 [Ruminiclostridium hungatei]
MKKTSVLFSIGSVVLIMLVIIGCFVTDYLYDTNKIGGIEKKASSILSKQAIKDEERFKSNRELFINVAKEIESLPSSITDIQIYNNKIQNITLDGTNYGGEQLISDISEQLELAILKFNSNVIDSIISKNHYDNDISFAMFYDSDEECCYGIDICYSKNEKHTNEDIIKLEDNWYLIKSINWGT